MMSGDQSREDSHLEDTSRRAFLRTSAYTGAGLGAVGLFLRLACAKENAVALASAGSTIAAERNLLGKYLAVPGAKATLPVSAAKKGFSADFVAEARKYFDNFHLQMGGDHALYYNLRMSEFLPTAVAASAGPVKELEVALDPGVGQVRFATKEGRMTLDQYVVHPHHRVQGLLIAYKGRIVYEAYPGMNKEDHHTWMSATKSTVGLVCALLEAEDKVDMQRQIVDYVPELKRTSWDGVTVLNTLNMSPGLDIEENAKTALDPTSFNVRFLSAAVGAPVPGTTRVEHWLDVVKEAKTLPNERQGEVMRYSSVNTMVLSYMAEKIENKPWIDIVHQRVWSKLGARGPIMINLTPEGMAMAMGLAASSMEDFARYGMLYTPSWNKVAYDQVVPPAVLKRIQTAGNTRAYKKSDKFPIHWYNFGEKPRSNSFQFDDVFADGALFKSGNLCQGIYVDPGRDVVGVYFSTNPYVPPYGEDKAPGFIRRAAKMLAKK
jgi:CubicO group peptidase (beta-lactamase class C family)